MEDTRSDTLTATATRVAVSVANIDTKMAAEMMAACRVPEHVARRVLAEPRRRRATDIGPKGGKQ